jgi:hypothetical protein
MPRRLGDRGDSVGLAHHTNASGSTHRLQKDAASLLLSRLLAVPRSRIIGFELRTRLFDIPVYRVSPEQWQQERDDDMAEQVSYWPDDELREQSQRRFYQLFINKYGDYPYNQIIGWVQVAWVGGVGHIKCYYYRLSVSRIGKHFRQGRYEERGKIADFHLLPPRTSIEMMAEIRRILINETRSRGSLRGRYLDMDTFDNLAPVLDLRKLMRLDRP